MQSIASKGARYQQFNTTRSHEQPQEATIGRYDRRKRRQTRTAPKQDQSAEGPLAVVNFSGRVQEPAFIVGELMSLLGPARAARHVQFTTTSGGIFSVLPCLLARGLVTGMYSVVAS